MLHRSLILPFYLHLQTHLSLAQIARLMWLPVWLLFVLFVPRSASGQALPLACGAGSSPATACEEACVFCNFDGYTGSTFGYPSGKAVDFCGTLENVQWLGFIAGKDKATFTIKPFNCLNGNGVQVALYNNCQEKPLACDKGKEGGAGQAVSITVNLSPGSNYFLLIDGYAGDQCEFSVDVSPKEAVYEPPLGTVGPIFGPSEICPGATAHFSVQPVSGASAYIWSGPPGSKIDTFPLPVVAGKSVDITFGSVAGSICVQAANSCEVNPPCTSTWPVQLLGDAARPTILLDTLEHLNCTTKPLQLRPKFLPGGSYLLQWSADSTGRIIGPTDVSAIQVNTAGTYHLLVTNPLNGCTSEAQVRVGEPDFPSGVDWDLRHVTCFGDHNGILQVQEVKGGKPPFRYAVDGGPLAFTPEYRYLGPGEHTLALEGADGCAWDTVFVVKEPGEWVLDLGSDTSIHLGTGVHLWPTPGTNAPQRIARMESEPPGLETWLCDTCRYFPRNSFRYRVTVVDSAGCRTSDDRVVTVSTERFVFVPNAFAPQAQDEYNRYLRVLGGEDVERVLSFRVFNRWGKILHERSDFPPNDEAAAWDGLVNGRQVPPDVFVWRAEVLFKDGVREQFVGDVTVVR